MTTTPEVQYAKLARHEFGRARFPRLDSLQPAKFQVLQAGLSSLGTSRYFERRPLLEWNPYAQALPVYHSSEPSGLPRNALLGAVGLAEAVHELVHILALEPVFTGARSDLSAQEFVDFSLIVEAYCYWYGELKYTRDADLRYADAKRVFHRGCSAASPRFHPDWVLKSEGVTNHRHAFDLYQAGFRGQESGLLNFSSPLGRTFVAIVYGFHVTNKTPTKRYFRRLKEIGVLGRWQGDVFPKFEQGVLFDVVGISPRESAAESYVRRFASSFELPISLNRRQLIHDTVGHGLQGMYLPNQLLEVLRTKARLWEAFRASPAGRARSKQERELLEFFDWSVHVQLGFEVDSTSNYLFNFVPEYLKRRMQTENQRIEDRYDDIGAGLPRELMPPTFHQAPAQAVFLRLFRRAEAIKGFPKSHIEQRFVKFSRQHKASGLRSHGLRLSSDLEKIRKIMAVPDLSERARFNLLRNVPFSRPLAHRWQQVRSLVGAPRL